MPIHARLEFNKDKTQLWLVRADQTSPQFEGPEILSEAIMNLKMASSVEFARIAEVYQLCEEWTPVEDETDSSENPSSWLLAESLQPVEGKNGYIDFQVNVTGEIQFQVAEEGKASDFKNQTSYTELAKDALIGVVHEPVPSVNGMDLFGVEIKVKPALAYQFKITEGARLEGSQILADLGGIPHFKKRTIYVKSCVCIEGDVGPETGNIKRSGCIHINGDVLEGFDVETDEDIYVRGSIYKANIKCQGDLVVDGGIQQDKNTSVEVDGQMSAKYLQGGLYRVRGDVRIAKNALHAEVESLENIQVCGEVVGGYIKALKSIEVKSSANPEGTKTRLKVLHHFEYEKLLALQKKRKEQALNIQEKYVPAFHDEGLTEEEKSEAMTGLEHLSLIKKELEMIHHNLVQFDKTMDVVYFPNIKWLKGYYAGTMIEFRRLRSVLSADNRVPVVAHLDKESHLITLKTQ